MMTHQDAVDIVKALNSISDGLAFLGITATIVAAAFMFVFGRKR